MRKVTKRQAEKALAEVARQLSQDFNGGEPVPTGREAAYTGEGPELMMDWDWPGRPTPTILLEGGIYSGWAVEIDTQAVGKAAGVFAEPWAGYALCLYPVGD